ncbi:MAG TPA: hypothetical protein VK524_00900 [Polyangiaceae bacterium]|nr:hypothetical protein [Polyangiaceae bacterium]
MQSTHVWVPVVLLALLGCGDVRPSPVDDFAGHGLEISPGPSGDANLRATWNTCPVFEGLSANPSALNVGGVASLVVIARDSDNGPAPLKYAWAVNGVRVTGQTAPTLSFVCQSVGEVTIAAAVSDGSPDPGCADSASVKVSCQ